MKIKNITLFVTLFCLITTTVAQAGIVTETVWSANFTGGDTGGFQVTATTDGTVDFSGENMNVRDPSNTTSVAYAYRDWTFRNDPNYTLESYTLSFRATIANDIANPWSTFMVCDFTEVAKELIYITGWRDKLDFSGALTGADAFTVTLNSAYNYSITHDLINDRMRIEITHPTYADYDSGWITGVSDDVATRVRVGTTASARNGHAIFDDYNLSATYDVVPEPMTLFVSATGLFFCALRRRYRS